MNRLLIVLIALLLVNCKTHNSIETPCTEGEKVTLKNLTGLDGCGWVFERSDGSKLEPTNLELYLNSPIENQQYQIRYTKVEQGVSICMVGFVVELHCIRAAYK